MIDISVDLTNEMMWSMLTTGDCEYLDPIYNSYQQWYGADYPNIKQYSGNVVTGGFEPEPGHRTRLPLTEVMQESGEPPYNKEVTCGITIRSEYAPRVRNTQVVLQNSHKVPTRQSLTWKSQGNNIYTTTCTLPIPDERNLVWSLLLPAGLPSNTVIVNVSAFVRNKSLVQETLKVRHPELGKLVDVTTKLMGSTSAKPLIVTSLYGEQELRRDLNLIRAQWDLSSLVGAPTRPGKLLVLWPLPVVSVDPIATGKYPAETVRASYRWNTSRPVNIFYCSSPDQRGNPISNLALASNYMFPPAIITVPDGESSAMLELIFSANGAQDYAVGYRIPNATFIPC